MAYRRSTRRIGAMVAGLMAATAIVFPAATAAAEPGAGLIDTTCSFDQLKAAAQVEAPEAVSRLENKPGAEAKMREFIALPVDERRARVEQKKANIDPEKKARFEEKRNSPEGQQKAQQMQRVLDTCHNY